MLARRCSGTLLTGHKEGVSALEAVAQRIAADLDSFPRDRQVAHMNIGEAFSTQTNFSHHMSPQPSRPKTACGPSQFGSSEDGMADYIDFHCRGNGTKLGCCWCRSQGRLHRRQ